MDRFSLLAAIAAGEAIRAAGLEIDEAKELRAGAIVGTGIYGALTVDEAYHQVYVEGRSRVGIFTVPKTMPGAPAGQVSMAYRLRGPVFGVTSACASSNHAFSVAADQLRLGRADVMLAGGHRRAARLRRAQGLGSPARPGARHMPALLGRSRRPGHRRGCRHGRARDLRTCQRARRADPGRTCGCGPVGRCQRHRGTHARRPRRRQCAPVSPTQDFRRRISTT